MTISQTIFLQKTHFLWKVDEREMNAVHLQWTWTWTRVHYQWTWTRTWTRADERERERERHFFVNDPCSVPHCKIPHRTWGKKYMFSYVTVTKNYYNGIRVTLVWRNILDWRHFDTTSNSFMQYSGPVSFCHCFELF